jgi:hypothetical protein
VQDVSLDFVAAPLSILLCSFFLSHRANATENLYRFFGLLCCKRVIRNLNFQSFFILL